MTAPTKYIRNARLVRPIDGDTIVVDLDADYCGIWLHNQTLRLKGIDTPEPVGATTKAGHAATEYLREMMARRAFKIETFKTARGSDERGKYGRYLAVVWLHSARGLPPLNVNECMIASGHAVKWE